MNAGTFEKISDAAARMKNPLVLAYIGDTIYDLFVRTSVVKNSDAKVRLLNKKVCDMVNARAQAAVADRLLSSFSEEEADIYRRGRNAKCGSVPKNMSTFDYHKATGLEAVVGYLFLTGRQERLQELFDQIL